MINTVIQLVRLRLFLATMEFLLTFSSADPDLSNPTRPRWERPLDTIRSFEAQIDAEFKTRQAFQRAGSLATIYTEESSMCSHSNTDTAASEGYGNTSRRSSSYWGNGGTYQRHVSSE